MQVTLEMILIVCPLALLAGFVDSVAGGGGLISLPAYLLAGLPMPVAAGTNKLSAALGTTVASIRYGKAKQVQWFVAIIAAAGALPGSALGAMLLQAIPENTMRIIVIAAIPLVAAIVLRRKDSLVPKQLVPAKYKLFVSFFSGLFIGFYDGLVGPGTGTFLILLFTLVLGLDAVKSSGTAKIVNLASNIAALVTLLSPAILRFIEMAKVDFSEALNIFLSKGNVLFLLGLPAALFTMAGGYLGSGLTIKRGAGFIRWMLMAVLALLLAKLIYDVVT